MCFEPADVMRARFPFCLTLRFRSRKADAAPSPSRIPIHRPPLLTHCLPVPHRV